MNNIPHQHRKIMERALLFLKSLAPDMPLMCLIAFPTDDLQGTHICSASNLILDDQIELLSAALDGITPIPPDTTIN